MIGDERVAAVPAVLPHASGGASTELELVWPPVQSYGASA